MLDLFEDVKNTNISKNGNNNEECSSDDHDEA